METQEQGGAVQSAELFAEDLETSCLSEFKEPRFDKGEAAYLIRARDVAIRRETAERIADLERERDEFRQVAMERAQQILDVERPRADAAELERDTLRAALKEIIALEDRGVGVTLANDKLRQAQAIAQDGLAARLTEHNLQSGGTLAPS